MRIMIGKNLYNEVDSIRRDVVGIMMRLEKLLKTIREAEQATYKEFTLEIPQEGPEITENS